MPPPARRACRASLVVHPPRAGRTSRAAGVRWAQVYSEIFATGGKSAFKYEVIVQNRTQLETLMAELRKVPDVTKCSRGKDYTND